MQLERVEIKDLNVGDKVYIPFETRWSWSTFRYNRYREATVTRITPKKTKVITNLGECDKYRPLYKHCEELDRQTKVADSYMSVMETLYRLTDSNVVSIKNLKDETILRLCDLMKEAKRIVEEDKHEQQTK